MADPTDTTPAGYAFATPERLTTCQRCGKPFPSLAGSITVQRASECACPQMAAPVDQGDAERLRAMAQKHCASMTENLTEEAEVHVDAVARYSDWSKAMRLAPERRQQYIDGHAMAADACRAALAHELSDKSDAALFERAAERAERAAAQRETQILLGRVLDALCLPGHAVAGDDWQNALVLGGRYCEPFLSWDFDRIDKRGPSGRPTSSCASGRRCPVGEPVKLSPERVREIAALPRCRRPWGRDDEAKTVRTYHAGGVGMQISPDPKTIDRKAILLVDRPTWREALAVMRAAGWTLAPDPVVVKRYGRQFANGYYLGERGTLRCEMESAGFTGVQLTFWSSTGGERTPRPNPNGPRHDFDKFACMTFLERMILAHTRRAIVRHFGALGWEAFEDPPTFKLAREEIEYRLRSSGHFHEGWDTESERPGARQCPYNSRDADGRHMVNGDVRYAYDHNGILHRGRVYLDINSSWWMEVNAHTAQCFSAHQLFTWRDRKTHPGRRPSVERIATHLKEAVKAEQFERAAKIRDERNRRAKEVPRG